MISFNKINIKTWAKLGSCGAFGIAAMEFPNIDENTVITTADLCFYSGLNRFHTQYPDRLYNMGIAEQNMVGVAAGMAKEGLNVFATTYATFASTRCTDQVRVNMGYMQLPVKLVGLTAGLSVGILGATHMSCEDIAILRAIPNITILSPADCTETVKASLAAASHKGPVYLRLSGGMNCPIVYDTDYDFEIGKAITLRKGENIAIIATGSMVYNALQVADILQEKGITCSVVNMHTIKPLDTQAIDSLLSSKMIVSLEEHSVLGGLGSAIAEHLSKKKNRPPHVILGISDEFKKAASYEYLVQSYHLDVEHIVNNVLEEYANL